MAARYGFVEVVGLGKMMYKFKREGVHWLQNGWNEAVFKATKLVENEAKEIAPSATGKLRGRITSRIDPRPMPRWGIVSTDATASDGTRYPFVLQGGQRTGKRKGVKVERINKRTGVASMRQIGAKAFRMREQETGRAIQLHYAGTGRTTRGWFNKALDANQGQVNRILNEAARKIEQQWSSG